MYSVYELICPIDNKIKYVGMSENVKQRYDKHCYCNVKRTKEWCLQLRALKIKPQLNIIKDNLQKQEALDLEEMVTNDYKNKNYPLYNLQSANKMTEQQRLQSSLKQKGIPKSQEAIDKMKKPKRKDSEYNSGKFFKGFTPWNKGKKLSRLPVTSNEFTS